MMIDVFLIRESSFRSFLFAARCTDSLRTRASGLACDCDGEYFLEAKMSSWKTKTSEDKIKERAVVLKREKTKLKRETTF